VTTRDPALIREGESSSPLRRVLSLRRGSGLCRLLESRLSLACARAWGCLRGSQAFCLCLCLSLCLCPFLGMLTTPWVQKRRKRISSNIQMLQHLVLETQAPDMASVLEDTVSYVQSLVRQVEVRSPSNT